MFVFHKEAADQIDPPEYYVISAENQANAAVPVLMKNKCISGNKHLLKFVSKRFDKILESIPSSDPAFYKLEQQNNLVPFDSAWWEESEVLVSLSEILSLGVKYNAVEPQEVLKTVLKPTDIWDFRLHPVLTCLNQFEQ